MPRMRMVKPEFWTDSKIVRISRDARLLFIGTWNFADCDAGHLEGDELSLKLRVFPADNIEVGPLLDELVEIGLIERFEFEGIPYLFIKGLRAHQRTDSRWTPRCRVCKSQDSTSPREHPGAPDDSSEHAETHVSSHELTVTHTNSSNLTPVREGKGRVSRGISIAHSVSDKDASGSEALDPSLDESWNEFWQVFPKKVAKKAAKKKFHTAVRQGADPQHIVAGARRYAEQVAGKDPKYIKQPDGWLNAGRWEDEVSEASVVVDDRFLNPWKYA